MQPFEQRGTAIIKRLPLNGRVAEVGVLIGKVSEFVLKHRPDVSIVMVDNWAPVWTQPERYKATGDVHAFHDDARADLHRREAMARVKGYSRATIMDMASTEAAALIDNASFDLVFLDADHSREGVLEDIAAWQPKVRPGGWIGGHDYANPDPAFRFGVTEAVSEWAGRERRAVELDLNFTWFCRL